MVAAREILLPGQMVFQEGEMGDCAYVIERGQVEISALRAGHKIVLARLGPGQIFGEMALIDQEMRSATVTVLNEAHLIVVSREQLRKRIDSADTVVQLLMKTLITRFRSSQAGLIGALDDPDVTELAGEEDTHPSEGLNRAFLDFKHEHEIEEAIDKGEFIPVFQPIVDLGTGRTAGFETLVRWRHPTRGYVSPMEFVELAEASGSIRAIDLLVLRAAWEQLEKVRAAHGLSDGEDGPFLSSNISGHHFSDTEIVREIRELLDGAGIHPKRMHLEITESVLIHDPEMALDILEQLKDLGVSIALDDFGTGYSSLSYLHRYPIDHLKIDRSFVARSTDSLRSLEIVRTIMSLAHTMRMNVVGEGVETDAHRDILVSMGCEYGQGYFFGKPLPVEDMAERLRQEAGTHAAVIQPALG